MDKKTFLILALAVLLLGGVFGAIASQMRGPSDEEFGGDNRQNGEEAPDDGEIPTPTKTQNASEANQEEGTTTPEEGLSQASEEVIPDSAKPFTIKVSGVVVDADGAPIAGAEITAEQPTEKHIDWSQFGEAPPPTREDTRDPWPKGVAMPKTVSDAEGQFAFEMSGFSAPMDAKHAARAYLKASTEGYLADFIRLDLSQAESFEVRFELAKPATIQGRVLDTNENPVDGALVWAYLQTPSRGAAESPWSRNVVRSEIGAKCGADGRFEIRGATPGKWTLMATRAGKVSFAARNPRGPQHVIDYDTGDPREAVMHLEAWGTLTFTSSNSALQEVVVLAKGPRYGATAPSWADPIPAKRARNGQWSAVCLRSTTSEVRVIAKGYQEVLREVAPKEPLLNLDLGSLEFAKAANLRGWVVDEKGESVPHAQIVLASQAYSALAINPFVLDKSQLYRGAWQRGKIAGEPFISDSNGRFEVAFAGRGLTYVSAFLAGYAPSKELIDFHDQDVDIKIVMPHASSARITLRGGAITTLPSKTPVYFMPSQEGAQVTSPQLRALEYGAELFVPSLSFEAPTTLEGIAEGWWLAWLVLDEEMVPFGPFEVHRDEVAEVSFKLPEPSSIFGRITNYDGAPLALAEIWINNANSGPLKFMTTTTDSAGAYTFEDVPIGSYYLMVPSDPQPTASSLGDLRRLREVVSSGAGAVEKDLDLSQRHGTTIRGKILFNGQPVYRRGALRTSYRGDPRQRLDPSRQVTIAADGSFIWYDVLAGAVQVSLFGGVGTDGKMFPAYRHSLEIAAGSEFYELNLEIRAYQVAGRVEVPEGKSVHNARLLAIEGNTSRVLTLAQDGSFSETLVAGTYTFRAELGGYAPKETTRDVNDEIVDLVLRISELGGSLRVVLKGFIGLTDNPVPERIVTRGYVALRQGQETHYQSRGAGAAAPNFAKVGDEGVIEDLAAGNYELLVHVDGFVDHRELVQLRAGVESKLEVTLTRAGLIRISLALPPGYGAAQLNKLQVETKAPDGSLFIVYGRHYKIAGEGAFARVAISISIFQRGEFVLRFHGEGFAEASVALKAEPASVVDKEVTLVAKR